MAASGSVSIIATLLGLGKDQAFVDKFALTNTPTKVHYNYRQQAAVDTEEALDLGGVSTVDLIVLKSVTNGATIDTTFNATYNAELNLPEGEMCIFKPSGTVYIKNEDSEEQVTYEYLVIGR